jgi:hypothetical protein
MEPEIIEGWRVILQNPEPVEFCVVALSPELLGAIAALTGTTLLPCSCGGHLTDDARAQCKAAESGWTAEGALPWRPAVGEECMYWLGGDWYRVRRGEDLDGLHYFYGEGVGGDGCEANPDYDGIRPLGSLPAPASVRAKAEGGAA